MYHIIKEAKSLTIFVAVKLSTGAFRADSKSGTCPLFGVSGPAAFGDSRPDPEVEIACATGFFTEPFGPAFGEADLVFMDASSSLPVRKSDDPDP